MESKIMMDEEVQDNRFGKNSMYYPVKIVLSDGEELKAMFTMDQLDDAVTCALKNQANFPK